MKSLKVGRQRASTISLKPLAPESSLQDYTEERLLAGMEYAQARITRKVTPRTRKLLEIYAQDCKAAIEELKTGSEGTLDRLLTEVRNREVDISNKSWLKEIPNSAQEAIEQELLKLRRYIFHARYGDYMAALTKILEPRAIEYKSDNWKMLARNAYWTRVSTKLHEESEIWKKHGSEDTDKVPITWSIYQAAKHVGIDFDAMISIIQLYAERNQIFHAGLDEALANEDYSDIAVLLDKDIKDLPSLVPMEHLNEETSIHAALVVLRNTWFDDRGRANPKAWQYTTALTDHAARRRADPINAAQEQAQLIAAKTAILLSTKQEEAALLEQAAQTPDSKQVPSKALEDYGAAFKKRKASTEMANDRRTTWKTCIAQQTMAHEFYGQTVAIARAANDTLLEYGEDWGSDIPSSPPPKEALQSPHTPEGLVSLFGEDWNGQWSKYKRRCGRKRDLQLSSWCTSWRFGDGFFFSLG